MNPSMQPATPPSMQPPVMSPPPQGQVPMMPPLPVRPKRTGLWVGLSVGIVLLLAAGGTALAIWLLSGSTPAKLVTEAAARFIEAEQFQAEVKLRTSREGKTITDMTAKLNNRAPHTRAEIEAKLLIGKSDEPQTLKISSVLTEQNVIVRAHNIAPIMEQGALQSVENTPRFQQLRPEDKEKVRQRVAQTIKNSAGLKPFYAINDTWVKVVPDDSCQSKILTLLADKQARQEVAGIFRGQAAPLKDGERLEDRNGGKGFVIDVQALKGEGIKPQLAKTQLGQAMSACTEQKGPADLKRPSPQQDEAHPLDSMLLHVWVNPSTRQLTALELTKQAADNAKDGEFILSVNMTVGQADAVEVPVDARDLKDVLRAAGATPDDLLRRIIPGPQLIERQS